MGTQPDVGHLLLDCYIGHWLDLLELGLCLGCPDQLELGLQLGRRHGLELGSRLGHPD